MSNLVLLVAVERGVCVLRLMVLFFVEMGFLGVLCCQCLIVK